MLDKDLVNKISQIAGIDNSMPGQIAHLAYRMFSKLKVEVDTEDVSTLPQQFQEAINNGTYVKQALDSVIEPMKMFSMQATSVLGQLSSLYGVQGPIQTYFPITDVGALRLSNYS